MINKIEMEDWAKLQLLEKDLVSANLQVDLVKTKIELVKTQLIMKYEIGPNDKINNQTRMIDRAQVQLEDVHIPKEIEEI